MYSPSLQQTNLNNEDICTIMMSLTQQCLYILQTIFTLKTLFPAPPEAGISRDKTIDGKLMQNCKYDENYSSL